MANGTHVDELTPAVPADLADSDLVYVGLPGDADPDRKMTLANLRAYLDDYFALLTGATFTGGVTLPNDGVLIEGSSPRIKFSETDTVDENWWLLNDAGRLIAQLRDDAGSFIRQMFAVDPDSGPLASASGSNIYPIADYGSNANGVYTRLYNGIQLAYTANLKFEYNAANSLYVRWTYPAAFTGAIRIVVGGLPTSSGNYNGLNLNSFGGPFIAASGGGTTNANLYIWDNSDPFVAGDWVNGMSAFAMGTWY